ncbi:MAG: hypothetical protein K8R40_03785 [Anaerolineaceae bacterium]|nr:hypothetical protein [Anaerolineaceae bacterium]
MTLLSYRGILMIGLTGILLLSACSDSAMESVLNGDEEQGSLLQTELSSTDTISSSETPTAEPSVTFTATPEPTNTATLTPTVTMTWTPSPTPFTGFEGSKINSYQSSGELYMYIFSVSGVSQEYYATIEKELYYCEIDINYPDILICTGEYFEFNDEMVDVVFYSDETLDEIVHQQEYYSGSTTPAPVIIYGGPETWCPERGQNVTCETEYRSYNGEECIVQTCFDACGYYYSYHTCPKGVPLSEFIFLPPPDER